MELILKILVGIGLVIIVLLLLDRCSITISNRDGGDLFTPLTSSRISRSYDDGKGVCFGAAVYQGQSDGARVYETVPRPCD